MLFLLWGGRTTESGCRVNQLDQAVDRMEPLECLGLAGSAVR